jgi:multiple sugar transport system permease protein
MSILTVAGTRPKRASVDTRAGFRVSWVSTIVLVLGALYCIIPVVWVLVASSKSQAELFSTNTFTPGTALFKNIADLSNYGGGIYWTWMLNTFIIAGVGALLSTLVSAMGGYALAKYRFKGKALIFSVLLAGVLVPGIILAVPQYFLMAKFGLTNSYAAVILPQIISPYGIYLARIYAGASVPDEIIEAARTDGARDFYAFLRIGIPMMLPGLVTVFLFQFVGIWNNFMLPYIMLGNDKLFPLTVGMYTMLNQGASQPALYTTVIVGSLVSIVPLIALFLLLQRYWRVDLSAGAVR